MSDLLIIVVRQIWINSLEEDGIADVDVMPVVLAGVEVDVAVLDVSAKKNNMDVSIHGFFRCGLFSLHSVTDMLILFCILLDW